jgi:pyrroloquinoline quinone biosynthesis protein A
MRRASYRPTLDGDESNASALPSTPYLASFGGSMKWQTPQASDMRFGFEITMYIANR